MESLPSIDCFKEDLLLNALFSGGRPKSPRGFKNSRIFSPQGAFVLNYSSTTIDFSQAHLYAALHVLKCPILLKYAYFSPSIPNQPFVLLLNRVAIRIVFSRFMFNVDLHFYTPKIWLSLLYIVTWNGHNDKDNPFIIWATSAIVWSLLPLLWCTLQDLRVTVWSKSSLQVGPYFITRQRDSHRHSQATRPSHLNQ